MAKLLKLRRGTTSQHSSFTGAEGEVTIDTSKDTAVVHDGSQAGGRPLAREDLNNVANNTVRDKVNAATDSNTFTDADHSKLNGIESGATADQSASEILTAIKTVDGSGSGLDADTLDGVQASSFLRSDANDSHSGTLSVNQLDVTGTHGMDNEGWFRNDDSGDGVYNTGTGQHFYSDHDDYWNIAGGGSANALRFRDDYNGTIRGYVYADNSNQIGFLNSSAGWAFKVDNSGNATATGNVTAYSDARLKTDIHTINDALGICGKLRGVSYKWLKDGKPSIGVIAQEVEKVLPEVVLTQQVLDPTGEKEVKSVDYGKIVGVLINAINELKAEVDELKGGK